MSVPRLAFGKHSSGKILHISQADNGSNCHCICPECDLPLVARTNHVTPHFAHRSETGSGRGCETTGQMTALHTFARDVFLNGGDVLLPALSQGGHLLAGPSEVALADVRTEQRFNGYQPDVIFANAGSPLLMEIAVTHPVPPAKAGLIRRQRMEAFEIDIKPGSVPGSLSLLAIENHVRHKAPRHWIFNELLEDHLRSLYHLDVVAVRGQLTSEKSRALAKTYDRLAGLPKMPVPALAAKHALVSEWLTNTRSSFEGYFRTSAEDWRTFVLLDCMTGLGLPLSRIVRRLKSAGHVHLELAAFNLSAAEAAEAGLPAFGVEACVFTFLSDLENGGAVVCLPGGIWRLLIEIPRQQPISARPVAARPTKGEYAPKRRGELEAGLQRIVAKLSPADREEFETGIAAWWTRPLDSGQTPLQVIAAGNHHWARLKQQIASIDHALGSDMPGLFDPLGLPMKEAVGANALRAAAVEQEAGTRRAENLRARALQRFETEIAEIWLSTRPSQKGLSPLEFAMASDAGLQISLSELQQRFVSKNRIPYIQEEFLTWVEKKFGLKGLRFIRKGSDELPDRRSPLQCCYDEISLASMKELTTRRV